ncbi:MAG TPA: helix-turn-helix domain-containing protein [Trinickia sp.]|uniref:winged helix-turn-helix transcriptional regulator n=1 Tax=Trinickia sp. TaxID=2571163 RepID=UPI002B67AEEF|nr:helix-turn-helix domain-containing protein [Trinickia sp.]HVW49405.1 helix-turn-helix domain-containing protein [Trinickia sp.]
MVKRTSHKEAPCAIARPLDAIGDWWSLLIVRDAFNGLERFGEFQKSLGLAKNILTVRLRNLVEHGILETVPASEGSAYQKYVLTEKGKGLFPLLVALRQWGEQYFFEMDDCPLRLIDKRQGLPVRRLELRSQDGRLIGPDDTAVVPIDEIGSPYVAPSSSVRDHETSNEGER